MNVKNLIAGIIAAIGIVVIVVFALPMVSGGYIAGLTFMGLTAIVITMLGLANSA